MRGLNKSKRVSWATDGNLCQVRMFLSEDSPSQVGVGTQDQMQLKKKTMLLYSNGSAAMRGNVLPPGFVGVNPEIQILKNKLAQITLPKWKCPPRFVMDLSWQVTVGEGSNEVEIENERELRVLEAIYPRPSAIPPNSVVSLDAENIMCDDSRTPSVPITGIEEEDVCEQVSSDSSLSVVPYPPGSANGVMPCQFGSASVPNLAKNGGLEECAQAQAQLLAAASAALGALLTSGSGPDKLIDHGLLVKILSDPAILEEFNKRQGNPSDMRVSSQSSQIAPNQTAPIVPMYNPPPPPPHFSQMENSTMPSPTPTPEVAFYPPTVPYPTIPSTAQSSLMHTGAPPPPKDMNYYKSLIQQHGGEVTPLPATGQNHVGLGGSPDPVVNARVSMESTPRFRKQCIYFNSPTGCRHGPNCSFRHASSLQHQQQQQQQQQRPEMHTSKRIKTSREIRGSQSYA